MANDSIDVIEIFCSYSHKDEELKDELDAHLSGMKRQGLITLWSDRQIDPATGWKQEIDTHLESAGVILLLISANFIASDYCYEKEMMRALQRDKKGEVRTIPIILRPVDWKSLPFGYLQALPTAGKPITSWGNRDKAFENVARGIRKVVEQLRSEQLRQNSPDTGHWTLILQGTIDEIDRPQVETILSTLRHYVGNSQLQLQRVETGSVNFVFSSSRKVFRVIQSKIHSGELTQVAGLRIIGIQETIAEETIETPRQSPTQSLFHQLQNMKNALRLYLTENQDNTNKEIWVVANGEPPKLLRTSEIAKLGGTGTLSVQEGNVAITMYHGKIERVVGAGTYQLKQDELPTITVYLASRVERVAVADVLTRDNKVIQNLELIVFHRVDRGNQSAESGQYRYDPQIILEKIWSPKWNDWRGAVKSMAESVVRDIIAQHDLEEWVAMSGDSRLKLVNELKEQINQKTKNYLGVEVIASDLVTITISEEERKVLEERWLEEFQTLTQALEAESKVKTGEVSIQVRQILYALAQLPVDEERKTKSIAEMFPDEQYPELVRVYTEIRHSP